MRRVVPTAKRSMDSAVWAVASLVALASGAEAAIIYRLRAPYLPGLVDAVHGIVLGTPAWQVFQSRVLGPYLMQLVAMLSGGDFRFAYLVVMAAAIVAKDLATYVAIRRFKGTLGAILPTLAGMALFVLLQDTWIYPWDPIDGAVSAAIIYVAAGEGSAVMLAVAYVVALLNRESSLYVGLYLAIEAVVRPARSALAPFAVRLAAPRRLVVALLATTGSIAVTYILRHALLVREAETGADAAAGWAQFGPDRPAWRYNIDLLEQVLGPDRNPLQVAAWLGVAIAGALILLRLWSEDFRLRKLALLALAEFAATMVFAVMLELRVFSGLLPFVVLFAFSSNDKPAEIPPAGRAG